MSDRQHKKKRRDERRRYVQRFISRKIKISFLKRLETCCSRRLPCGRAVDAVWG